MRLTFFFCLLAISQFALAQPGPFSPAAGQPGSTAVHKDDPVIVAWGTQISVERAWQNIADTSYGKASHGNPQNALGPANNQAVSLGDGGTATYIFNPPLQNVPGYDFAVFENSFDDYFLELAFVEISSNGQDFYRFPATSLTQDTVQVGTFDLLHPTNIHNLAGKYRGSFGVPFRFEDLDTVSGLNVNAVTHIRIVDVVGSIDPEFATYDHIGNAVNDPWPTPFPSSGFDLDALAILGPNTIGVEDRSSPQVAVFPNPSSGVFRLRGMAGGTAYTVFDLSGAAVAQSQTTQDGELDLTHLNKGVYLLQLEAGYRFKLILN